MEKYLQFISNNQMLLSLILVVGSYFLNKLINYLASRPQEDIWDKIKPASDSLYALVHEGIEAYSKANPMSSIAKNAKFLEEIKKFEEEWYVDKGTAIKNLAAWYLSMKKKEEPSELTADTVAVESES